MLPKDWTAQVASDVVRDGLGLELLAPTGEMAAEVFRSDAEHSVVSTTFAWHVPDEALEWLHAEAPGQLGNEYEDGTAIDWSAMAVRTWRSYRDLRRHPPDFIVEYRLYRPAEGGRDVTYQHLRCDWCYAGDDPVQDGIFMIHPEFLDGEGRPLPSDVAVPPTGRASMWILVPKMRGRVHQGRIQVGVRGHFMEGARRIGDATVVEVVGLQ